MPTSARALQAPLAVKERQVDPGSRPRLRAVQALEQGQRDVEVEICLRRPVTELGGIAREETFGAGATRLLVAEQQQVGQEAAEVEAGVETCGTAGRVPCGLM